MNVNVQFSRRTKTYLFRVFIGGILTLSLGMVNAGQILQAEAKGLASSVNEVDDFPGVKINSIPFDDTVDVTDATTDTDSSGDGFVDPTSIVSGDCDSNEGLGSVWYNYKPTENTGVFVDTIGSNYDTLVAVWKGDPGSLILVACNDDISTFEIQSEVGFFAQADTTYYIEIIEFVQPAPGAQASATKSLNFHVSQNNELPPSWYGSATITSNQPVIAVGRPHIGDQVLSYNGFANGSLNAYVPMLFKDAFGGDYDSALYVQNVDLNNSADITIHFYDSSGVETHSITDTISSLATKGYWLPSISALGTSWVGGVKVEADKDIVAVGRPHVGDQVLSYNGFANGSLNAYVPMLFKDAFGGDYDSALYIQNLDTTNTANITIRFYDSNGVETHSMADTVSALASKGYWLPSINALGTSWVGGVKIESDQNIVAVGRPHIGDQVLSYNGFTSGSTNAYVPMMFKDAFGGDYDSALYIQNLDTTNIANITIRFYDNNGVETYSTTDSISALASKGYWLPAIAPLGTSWVGGVKVESDQDIVAVGRPHVGDQVLSYNGFTVGSVDAYVPMLFKNAFGGGYDSALYIQNVDPSSAADVTIYFFDVNGVLNCVRNDTIPALATFGYWIPSLTCSS